MTAEIIPLTKAIMAHKQRYEPEPTFKPLADYLREFDSDNIRISSIRPWQPEDDGDPAA